MTVHIDVNPASQNAKLVAKQDMVRADWARLLEKVQAFKGEAYAEMEQALASKTMTWRDIWLVLGVFETEEKYRAAGRNISCKSVWYDRVAPRVKEGARFGVSGFSAKSATRAPQFLENSRNGYTYLTNRGYALALALRDRYPALNPALQHHPGHVLPLDQDNTLPAPRWRAWSVV